MNFVSIIRSLVVLGDINLSMHGDNSDVVVPGGSATTEQATAEQK